MSKSKLRHMLLWFSLLLTGLALAGEPHYASDIHDANWTTQSSPIKCSLSHTIPYYGRAEFVRHAGLSLSFRIYVEERPVKGGEARLHSMPPEWKHDVQPRELGSVTYKAGVNPFRFERELSLRVMQELEKGMQPTLSFKDLGDGSDTVSVAISNVNFLPAMEKFRHCSAGLVHYSFAAVKNMYIHFPSGGFLLSADARRRLDAVAAFMKLDSTITGLLIEGHTDIVGTDMDNDILSNQRATVVRDYLLEQGIPQKDNITLRYYGKRKPLAANKSATGRAKNRRAYVKLLFE